MKKAAYIIGSIEIIVGIILLSMASIIKQVMPILGRVAYQAAAAGGYSASNYEISFPFVTVASIALIVLGLFQICYFGIIRKDKQT